MRRRTRCLPAAVLLALAVGAATLGAQERRLGPADGLDLPAVDTGRVKVGALAPDFTLLALTGDTVTLSSFRGRKLVLLQFYRGHW